MRFCGERAQRIRAMNKCCRKLLENESRAQHTKILMRFQTLNRGKYIHRAINSYFQFVFHYVLLKIPFVATRNATARMNFSGTPPIANISA